MTTDVGYTYRAPSALLHEDSGAQLGLATSGGVTDLGAAAHPFFFSGFVEHPGVVAQSLLVVARVARTRFYTPPNTLAAVLRAADPVVTSTPDGLRFESFSVCCGVYARLDVDAAALDATYTAAGVTNVDVNPPLRQALAGLRPSEPLHLSVGDDELRVATLDAEVVEEKVQLPPRWLKGFAETQALSAGMTLQHTLDGVAARQLIQSLPRSTATKTVMWATRATRSLRLASRPSAGAVCVAGPERLRAFEPLLLKALSLRAYGPPTDASSTPTASVWVLDLPGARLTLGLSPEKSRGFSGEGSMLHALAGAEVTTDAAVLSTVLAFEPRIDVTRLAAESSLTPLRVTNALTVLASSGQVGFDVAAGAYFHRPLPLLTDALSTHPRLADAHELVAAHAVSIDGDVLRVQSGSTTYDVRLAATPTGDRCTCPWYAKHQGSRGPCKHVLAARITLATAPSPQETR